MKRTLLALACPLSLVLALSGCGEDDEGKDDTGMTENPSPSATSGSQNAADGDDDTTDGDGSAVGEPEPDASSDDDSGDAPGAIDPGGTDDGTGEPGPADDPGVDDPGSEDPSPVTPAAVEANEAVTNACERAAECTGQPANDCVDALSAGVTDLWAICPDRVNTYLECLAETPTCAPEVDCAEETEGLGLCFEDVMVDVDPAVIEMACANWSECEGEDADQCVMEFELTQGLLEAACPGVFGPYIECIATMTGCDPEAECGAERMALETCGLGGDDAAE